MADELNADVVIVGAGIAGALIAYKLAKRGLSVIVLEAGKRFSRSEILEKQQTIWQEDNSSHFPNTPLAPRSTPSASQQKYIESVGPVDYNAHYLRGVGGTTWHWQAVCHRLLPEDMQLNSKYGVGINWPYSYQELEPFYALAERELGVGGEADFDWGSPRSTPFVQKPVAESYAEQKIKQLLKPFDIAFRAKPAARNSAAYGDRPACEGHHNCSNMCPIGAQYSAIVHVEKSEQHGAQYLSEALATDILTDQQGQVTGIKFKRSDQTTNIVRARAFVLAANPLETTRLCLSSSNETLPNGVANSSNMVGKRLMDHPVFDYRFDMSEPVYGGRGPFGSIGNADLRAGSRRKQKASSILSFENIDLISEIANEALNKHPQDPIKLKQLIRYKAARRLVLGGTAEQLPDVSNRVFVDHNKKDTSGMPRIKVSYSLDDYTLDGLTAAQAWARNIIQKLDGQDIRFASGFFGTHASGTMMMGNDDTKFVTDSDGRTHDHSNLFVAGSSLFPAASAANPTLTIAAVALRTEQKIASQLES